MKRHKAIQQLAHELFKKKRKGFMAGSSITGLKQSVLSVLVKRTYTLQFAKSPHQENKPFRGLT